MSAPSLLALPGTEVPECCEDETWAPIPDWPHEASTCGRVRSIDRLEEDGIWRLGAMLPQQPDKNPGKGYLYADLADGPRRRRGQVHVLVLEAWAGLKPTPAHEGCHGNGIRTDNHRVNLSWGTKRQNRADRERHRQERAVTDQAPEMSQEGLSPRWRRLSIRHGPSVTSDNLQDTGRSPFPFNFPSRSPSVNPFLRTLRTSFKSLRNRKAA